MRGFKYLVLGTIFAKLFGIIRELLILSEFGYSYEISFYFSLIAILSILIFFSDTSIINSIAFPIWLEKKGVVIKLNFQIIISILIIPLILFFYNYILFDSNDKIHLMIVISIVTIPLIINSILYSILIYLDKRKEFLIVAFLNGLVYLVLTFVLIDYGVIGLIYSRLISIIFNIVLILFFVWKDIEIKFLNYSLKPDFIKKSVARFISVNNVLFFVLIIRIFSSLFFINQMALINYSMLIVLTFYTVFSKNLNSQLIKQQIQTFTLSKKMKKIYWLFSTIFFIGIFILILFTPNNVFFYDYTFQLQGPLKLSLFLIIPILILGYFDLSFQAKLANKLSYKFLDSIPLIFSFIFYYFIMVLYFVKDY